MEELRVLSPTAILGYGFPVESFEEGMKRRPHVIAVDAGSTDPGPFYSVRECHLQRNAVKDLEIMITAAVKEGYPVIIGGRRQRREPHLQWTINIIREIAFDRG